MFPTHLNQEYKKRRQCLCSHPKATPRPSLRCNYIGFWLNVKNKASGTQPHEPATNACGKVKLHLCRLFREFSTESGSINLVYVNESGFITIRECKLWRNPEARRKVVGQILDYAKDLAKWDYSKFEVKCLKARKERDKSLFQRVEEFYPEAEEATFIDNLQNNLNKGRFLLTIIGDGIRTSMEELTNFIHRNRNLNFTDNE